LYLGSGALVLLLGFCLLFSCSYLHALKRGVKSGRKKGEKERPGGPLEPGIASAQAEGERQRLEVVSGPASAREVPIA